MIAPIEPRAGGWDPGDHGEWDALAVGWALSALEPGDEARFAVHLPTCERCTDTVRESLRTVADLAYAVPDEAPPAGLKRRIMLAAVTEPRHAPAPRSGDAVRDTPSWPRGEQPSAGGPVAPQGNDHAGPTGRLRPPEPRLGELGPGPGPRRDGRIGPDRPTEPGPAAFRPDQPVQVRRPVGGRHAAPDGPDDPPHGVVPLAPRRRRWAAAVAAAAAAVLIVALAVWNAQLRSDRDDLRQIVAQREAAIAQLTADGPVQVAAVQAVTPELKPLPTRRATIVVKDGRTQIIIEALAPRTGVETYWLWTLNCDVSNLKPITGFQVDRSGFSVQNVGSDPGLSATQCFALSAESVSGTPTKPGTVVAVGQLK